MRSPIYLMLLILPSACASTTSIQPSLAPRPAEAIDPRVPVPDQLARGELDPDLAAKLDALVNSVRAGVPAFEQSAAEAERLAAQAGAEASESWIAAQQALSRLVAQYGVTTRSAADIDALAAGEVEGKRWIEPADREAIARAAADVQAISQAQAATIDRLTNLLRR